jgi:hypothetical protein
MDIRKIALAGLFALPFSAAQAVAETPAFSADLTQTDPRGGARTGQVYVAGNKMRLEFRMGPRTMVQIVDADADTVTMVMGDQKRYVVHEGGAKQMLPGLGAPNPCGPQPEVKCDKTGSEKYGDQTAETWTVAPPKAPFTIKVWWDPKRKISLRQEYSDGRVATATKIDDTKVQGREVELWETSFLMPNGGSMRGQIVYDKQLGFATSERQPGGMMYHYRNIRTVDPKAEWFQLPKDFEKVVPPTPEEMRQQMQERRQHMQEQMQQRMELQKQRYEEMQERMQRQTEARREMQQRMQELMREQHQQLQEALEEMQERMRQHMQEGQAEGGTKQ